jgi:hypothetical protein
MRSWFRASAAAPGCNMKLRVLSYQRLGAVVVHDEDATAHRCLDNSVPCYETFVVVFSSSVTDEQQRL